MRGKLCQIWDQSSMCFSFPPVHQGWADRHFLNCTSSLKQVTKRKVIFHFQGLTLHSSGRKKMKALHSFSLKQFSLPFLFPAARGQGDRSGMKIFPQELSSAIFYLKKSRTGISPNTAWCSGNADVHICSYLFLLGGFKKIKS